MITEENGVFHIRTETYSYLFKIDAYGLAEHLHFGAPVKTRDAGALSCRPGLGWGASILLDPKDTASCPDALPLEWSGSGRGDYRESPLELTGEPGDFRYAGYKIHEGGVPMACGLPQAHDAPETLEITLRQPGAELTLFYTAFPTAIVRRTVLTNTGDKPLRLNKLMSSCVDLPGSYTMATFNGGWIAEMRRCDTPVGASKVVNETRVMQGINDSNFSRELPPGECFETPEAVLCHSGKGFGGLSANMHAFVTDHIIPPHWRGRPRPVLYNSWEGCTFDFSQRRLLSLANRAKALGCELFVLDDGWFGKRDSDTSSLGDYSVNAKKLPNGLNGLGEKLNALGLQFGLWFEPESVSPDSELYRSHPDWALHDDLGREDLLGRHQLLLDLTKPEVRDYIVRSVGGILDSAPISYVKWDMNRHSCALGAKQHAFVLGLYDVLRRIFEPRPEILLESCSSGGNRFDCGMLYFSPQIWCSDDTDPVERLRIQQSLSYLYPPSTFGAHVSASPHAQTLRATPLSTRGNVSLFGCLGYELDLTELLPVEQAEIRAQIEFYKAHRRTLQYGRFTRGRTDGGGVVWQAQTREETVAGVFHGVQNAASGYERLRVTGLDAGKRYRLESRAQLLRVGDFGSLLRHVLPVKLNPNGLAVQTADSYYKMYDGQQTVTASGAAYGAGIMLAPRFAGTGYDADGRMQSDFGSNVYFIREVQS